MASMISHKQEKNQRTRPSIYSWLFTVIGMSMLFTAAYLPDVGPVPLCRAGVLFLFRSMWIVKMTLFVVVTFHFGEAVYAWKLAKTVDPHNANGWFWQTLVLGFLSLWFLLKKQPKDSK